MGVASDEQTDDKKNAKNADLRINLHGFFCKPKNQEKKEICLKEYIEEFKANSFQGDSNSI